MSTPISNIRELLGAMQPVHNPGVYVFASIPHGHDTRQLEPVATIREAEGLTVIVEEDMARAAKLPILFRSAWITLNVHSDLHAIGLTAAFSSALGAANISCNVVAGAFHDHIFVPVESIERAMTALHAL